MPRKVKFSSRSHSRKAIASATAVLVERHRRIAELRDRLVEPRQHRLPVAHRGADLLSSLSSRVSQLRPPASAVSLATWTWMRLTRSASRRPCRAWPSATICCTPVLPCRTIEHRMDDQRRLAGDIGDLAHDRIEQERHVVVDGGDHRDRLAVPDERRDRNRWR